MTELQQYINSYFGITTEHMQIVSELFQRTELKKGDFFNKSGQFCNKLSFVKEGFIRIFLESNDKDVTQWISSKGFFIADLASLIFKQRSRWNMQALTDCTLYTIEKDNYEKLNELVPNWSEMEKRFIAGCFMAIEDRVFSHLSLSSEERYDLLFKQNPELFNAVPLQYIASMLGMTPETLSRIRTKRIS